MSAELSLLRLPSVRYHTCCILSCLVCIVVYCLAYLVVVVLGLLLLRCCTRGVLLLSYVYYARISVYVRIAVRTLDAGLLARSQYSEGPATGHLEAGFSWFPCVYK
jgi:hypothetical protein